MQGPQFVHIETYARKANPAGQCVDQVLGEAERLPEYSKHVELPRLPEVIEGMSVSELRAAHAAMVAGATTVVPHKGGVLHRAIRQDRHTLVGLIASYPLSWNQIGHYPHVLVHLEEWERATIKWARDQFGPCFAAAIRHRDELHPHLHIYALPVGLRGVDAKLLHPGKRAKHEAFLSLLAEGAPRREALRAANVVFREVMREWQDDYYRAVGEPLGLTRTGPRRRRLSRAAWQAETREARLRAERLTMLEFREAHADARKIEQDMRDHEQDARDRDQNARASAVEAREEALALAVTLVAEGRLRTTQGRVQAPPEHHEALRLVWPTVGAAMGELMALRDHWSRGIDRVMELLRRNKMAANLRVEATRVLEGETGS